MQGEIVNQPVINIFLQPEEGKGIDSQAVYGEAIEIVKIGQKDWIQVKTKDNVTGWVKRSQIVRNQEFEKSPNLRSVKNLFAHVYPIKDTAVYVPLLTLPYKAQIKLSNPQDPSARWLAIELATGKKAYIQKKDIYFKPFKSKNLKEVLAFSRKFIGLPYTWGGKSSFGFDCSGFVQMLIKETGIVLPRNSKDQAQSVGVKEVALDQIRPGDLLFFGKKRISHVGLYLGDNKFIHSGTEEKPIIMISSLTSGKYHLLTARRLR